tara:strand:+ start:168 stop:554 length:387 start_codon:yes stop_codon:yes gene_type:complete
MKILGIGVDIIDNKRIKRSIKNDKFVKRIFSKKEINSSKNFKDKVNFLAKRFAAKEALSKTFGTGFRSNLNYKDIQILNDQMGKPYYLISKKIKDVIYAKFKKKNINLFLSISDEKDYSIAFAILQTK